MYQSEVTFSSGADTDVEMVQCFARLTFHKSLKKGCPLCLKSLTTNDLVSPSAISTNLSVTDVFTLLAHDGLQVPDCKAEIVQIFEMLELLDKDTGTTERVRMLFDEFIESDRHENTTTIRVLDMMEAQNAEHRAQVENFQRIA